MAETVILAETTLTFEYISALGAYAHVESSLPFLLETGKRYTIEWDGIKYVRAAFAFEASDGSACIAVGNPIVAGETSNNDPFAIACDTTNEILYYFSTETAETHTVAVSLTEGIVLKDRNGNDVAYYGIETVTFDTTTEGKQQTFTKGVAVENLEIVPDFSGGDMAVNAPEGVLVKSAVVKQPAGLTPGNIRNGTEVAGVTGDFIGDTETAEVALSMADGDQVIAPSAEGKVLSHVVVKRPDTLVPENIAENVDIGGVIGSFKGGGGNAVQIVTHDNSMAQWFQTRQDFNGRVTIPNTITNLYQTFYSCNSLNQPIEILGDITTMYETFYRCENFNQPITVMGNNLSLHHTFGGCSNFNQPVTVSGSCDTANNAFGECYNFNRPVVIPDTCKNIDFLFYYCPNFNQPFTIPSAATSMANTFYRCSNFNQPVTLPSNLTSVPQTFMHCNRFDQPVVIPNKVTSLWNSFANCPNMQNITILSPNVNYLAGMVRNTNNSVRLNIHVPAGSITNTTIAYTNTYSVIGNTITWTTDSTNRCRYNSVYNIYVYWDL